MVAWKTTCRTCKRVRRDKEELRPFSHAFFFALFFFFVWLIWLSLFLGRLIVSTDEIARMADQRRIERRAFHHHERAQYKPRRALSNQCAL